VRAIEFRFEDLYKRTEDQFERGRHEGASAPSFAFYQNGPRWAEPR